MERKYEIKENRLVKLLAAELELNALNCGGVDNWEWCGDSISDALAELANEYNLDREDLSFEDVARHMINVGDI